MLVSKKKMVVTAASFGAAMTSLYAAPELNASIVTLTFSPGSIGTGFIFPVAIDQLGTAAAFSQWNDTLGKTLSAAPNIQSLTLVALSQVLSTATFSGTNAVGFSAGSTGTVYIGFKDNFGNLGWFSLNLGGTGGNIVYLTGEWGNAGESLTVGGTAAIPEPGTATGLALLALGASGLRRRRQTASQN